MTFIVAAASEWRDGPRGQSQRMAVAPLHGMEPDGDETLCGLPLDVAALEPHAEMPFPSSGLGGKCHECKAVAGDGEVELRFDLSSPVERVEVVAVLRDEHGITATPRMELWAGERAPVAISSLSGDQIGIVKAVIAEVDPGARRLR